MKTIVVLLVALFSVGVSADYAAQAALAADPVFQDRVKIAAFIAAVAIVNESTSVANHPRRTLFAQTFVHNSASYVPRLALGVAADPAITAASTDAAIQVRVNEIWETFAGKD